jgi:hypothetical protein
MQLTTAPREIAADKLKHIGLHNFRPHFPARVLLDLHGSLRENWNAIRAHVPDNTGSRGAVEDDENQVVANTGSMYYAERCVFELACDQKKKKQSTNCY